MFTNKEVENIISKVKFRNWDVLVRYDGPRQFLQVQFDAPDSFTGVMAHQYCRKWMLSPYMTETELVRTAYKAVEAAVLHEAQEDFRYMDEAVYRPHFDIKELWKLSNEHKVEHR